MGEETTVSKNFIEQEIDKILQKECTVKYVQDSHRNQTDICISDMQSLFF